MEKVFPFKTLLVLVVGLIPPLFSILAIRKSQMRMRNRMRRIASTFPNNSRLRHNSSELAPTLHRLDGDRYYLEGVGYLIGDITCEYNARSGYIRCAVNPNGPCEGCRCYQPRITELSQ
ncbi:DUF6464 family protein [Calothrix sp. NIES-3974]|uniref:DUF6464 family protein n=1 Tax=Calothrix sp. NIES-3974 TaxID=2005462 RepID=UPI000B61E7D8|nr:hypothetical protein NIES3974_46480 [Calothrix sp. NIES-3974]